MIAPAATLLRRPLRTFAGRVFLALPLLALSATHTFAQPGDGGAPTAVETVRARLDALPLHTADEGAWMRARLLRAVIAATGVLPAPTPVDVRGDTAVWTLVTDAATDPARFERVCDEAARVDRTVACARDTVAWAGAERARVVFGWRATSGGAPPGALQPLRALRRLGEGVCLVHAERTLRTLDLTVRAPDHETLGRALALMTVSPAMQALIVVRAEPVDGAIEAVLSWPLVRGSSALDLGDDPWPVRCDGRSVVGREAVAGTVPVALAWVRGTASQGAVLRVGRREWVLTAGDRAASVDVVTARATGVTVRYGRRTAPLRYLAR